MLRLATIPIILALTTLGGPAGATAIINAQEVSGDVVFDLTGSLDLSGAIFETDGFFSAGIAPSVASLSMATGAGIDLYDVSSGPASYGTGGTFFTTATGDSFFVSTSEDRFGVPDGYVSGTGLATTMTFSGESFASLGMTVGTYVWEIPSDTIVLNVVPEPGTGALLAAGLFAIASRRSARTGRR